MKKVDKTVLNETKYMALFVLLLSALMQAVFLILRKWDYTVLTGNILCACAMILNFFLMGLTVQAATSKEEKEAKTMIRASQSLRFVALFAALTLGVLLPCFNTVASLVPIIFPRIAVFLRPLIKEKKAVESDGK